MRLQDRRASVPAVAGRRPPDLRRAMPVELAPPMRETTPATLLRYVLPAGHAVPSPMIVAIAFTLSSAGGGNSSRSTFDRYVRHP